MNNGNETLGLRVISTSPEAHMANVNVNSKIEITFSSDVNPESLKQSMVVFEDYKNIYEGVTSLKTYNNFNVTKGSVKYSNRVLTFTPEVQFNVNTRYVVMLNNTIRDITGNVLMDKFVFAFNTELVKSYGKTEIVAPLFGAICDSVPTIEWKNQLADSYILQVSKSNDFESLLYEKFVVGNAVDITITHRPAVVLKEGIWYVRIKAEGGEWSDPQQIFYKEVVDAVVAIEDATEDIYLEDFLADLNEPIDVLEFFPPQNSMNISLKTNIFYIKIKGKLDENVINVNECMVFGEAFDEEDDAAYQHGEVFGHWSIVYDTDLDVTFVIFTPDTLAI